ncbi:CLUMA_CG002679, isoform A [Clunio marinus]|uniref:CLUMA_CG002679, isoform A n=1 Tax=Clunio marinus TaxID=568069 RepID=A0A1J1HLP2_9DIPT|nr:CLUMA_CG002679, isoform A [Clunio marinus]
MKVSIIFITLFAYISATTLKCQFTKNTVFSYVCEIRKVELIDVADEFIVEHDDHQKDKSDSDVKMVSFIDSTINVVPNQIFSIFPNLDILDLVNTRIKKWNRDNLKSAKHLRRIWLAYNQIEELFDNSFIGATGLENLLLDNNKISKIGDKTFNGLSQVKSLEFQNNFIKTLSEKLLAPLKKLKELNLSENKISHFDENAFHNNGRLEFLNLASNNITVLPEKLFHSQLDLTILYLHNNQITKLSPELFADCSALMELRLDHNRILEIPLGMFTNNQMFKLLNIMHNDIDKFNGKVLPEEMELLYLDESVETENIMATLEIIRGEKKVSSLWTQPDKVVEYSAAE